MQAQRASRVRWPLFFLLFRRRDLTAWLEFKFIQGDTVSFEREVKGVAAKPPLLVEYTHTIGFIASVEDFGRRTGLGVFEDVRRAFFHSTGKPGKLCLYRQTFSC